MNAALDKGNTRIKIGYFNQDDLIEVIEVAYDNLLPAISEKPIQNIILSSVKNLAPKLLSHLKDNCENLLVLDSSMPLPIAINYATPETIGVDRLAAAVGALEYGQGNKLIIDIGSCITIDLLDKNKVFQGGLISPGMNMRLKAMHQFTDQLPLVELRADQSLIGKSTRECLISGAVNGTIAEISQIIRLYIQQFGDLEVIICGGDAVFFDNKLEIDTFVVPNLVLEGLNSILRFNGVD